MSIKKTEAPAEVSPEDAAVIADAAADLIVAADAPSFRVLALQAFGDVKPTRSYTPGDEVIGWNRARADHYAKQGLVEVIEG